LVSARLGIWPTGAGRRGANRASEFLEYAERSLILADRWGGATAATLQQAAVSWRLLAALEQRNASAVSWPTSAAACDPPDDA
jgi:hypothetical protein